MYQFSVIENAPSFTRGLVRELRVRWALEEIGASYEEIRLPLAALKSSENLKHQPFGQVPYLKHDDLELFETGAIVLHLGEKDERLLPRNPSARARAMSWCFAALNSVEPMIQNLASIDFFYKNEEWAKLGRPHAEQMARKRVEYVSGWLGDRPYLEEEFTAGDLLMTTVLRILRDTPVIQDYRNVREYVARNEARSAFQRALAAHRNLYPLN